MGSDMVRAEIKNQRSSVKKVQLVAKLVRGKSVPVVLTSLQFMNQKSAGIMLKVLRSAIANAENNMGLDSDDMYVSAVLVNKGPTLKRWRARAKGRSARILKRSVHVVIELANKAEDK